MDILFQYLYLFLLIALPSCFAEEICRYYGSTYTYCEDDYYCCDNDTRCCSKISVGAIVGIVIGCIAGIVIFVLVVKYFVNRHNRPGRVIQQAEPVATVTSVNYTSQYPQPMYQTGQPSGFSQPPQYSGGPPPPPKY